LTVGWMCSVCSPKGTSRRQDFQQSRCEFRALAGIFVFEKDERLFPGFILNALAPGTKILVAVVRPAQAEIAPVRGGNERNAQFASGIGNSKGGVAFPESSKNFFVDPGLVPDLQRGLPIFGQQIEEST